MDNLQNPLPGEKRTLDALDFEVYHMHDSDSGSTRMHNHDFFELFFLLSGSMDYIIEGQRYTLSDGSLLIIPPNELHRPDVSSASLHNKLVLWISPAFVAQACKQLPSLFQDLMSLAQCGHHFRPDDTDRQSLEIAMRALLREQRSDDVHKGIMCHSILFQIMILIRRMHLRSMQHRSAAPISVSAGEARADYDLTPVFAYINAHLTEDLTVGSLAERFFFNPNTLTRRFRSHAGMSVSEYIREKRLTMARLYIYQGMSAVQAGAASGFSDYTTFYRAFRRQYAISPKAFSQHAASKTPPPAHDAH